MPRFSQNGWFASPNPSELAVTPLVVGGASFAPGVRAGDVHTVLGYVATQVHERVEATIPGHCWGYSFRDNANDPNSLSNHSSATAIDYNAPEHPNGVPASRTFTAAQIGVIHEILNDVDHVVRWGGDYTGTPDAMHFEINASVGQVAEVAQRLRNEALLNQPRPRVEHAINDLVKARDAAPAGVVRRTIRAALRAARAIPRQR